MENLVSSSQIIGDNSLARTQWSTAINSTSKFDSVLCLPQRNGQVESANKEILNGIKKKIEGAKGTLDEELPDILWARRTTIKEAIGHTPLSLVYGSEVLLPVDIGIPSTRVTFYTHGENDVEKRINLGLLPETRGNTLFRSIAQK